MFTLCIPTMDRFGSFLSNYLPRYLNNKLIGEIVITDENGNDATKIKNAFPDNEKIKIFVNQNQLGPFLNKLKACSHASNEWIVLIDSDNFAADDYFVKAAEYISAIIGEQKNVILAPSFASPNFNYSHLSGFVYEKERFQSNNLKEKQIITSNNTCSETLMNTGNYVINKYLVDNLDLSKEVDNIKYSSACDVIYFNTMLFEQLELQMHIVPNMVYDHVVHSGSIYTQTHAMFRNFNDYVRKRYYNLF